MSIDQSEILAFYQQLNGIHVEQLAINKLHDEIIELFNMATSTLNRCSDAALRVAARRVYDQAFEDFHSLCVTEKDLQAIKYALEKLNKVLDGRYNLTITDLPIVV